jgi:hypothetical protein
MKNIRLNSWNKDKTTDKRQLTSASSRIVEVALVTTVLCASTVAVAHVATIGTR